MAENVQQRNRWWLVVAVSLGIFMATLDSSIVAVALPAMERDFGVRTAATEWIVLGYLLPLIALTLPAGRWLNAVGWRAAMAATVGGFTLASVAAGAAPDLGWLVAARVVQGGFAGVMFALLPMITTTAVRPALVGRASALAMTFGPLGAVSGPALGGLIVEAWGWPWIFYINVPVGLLVIVIGLAQMPAGGSLRLPDRSLVAETVVLAAATAALLLGLSLTASHGLGWLSVTLLSIVPIAVWWRMRSSREVRALMRIPTVAGPVSMLALNAMAITLVEFLAPFYLQRVLGVSAAAAGTAILAFPVGMVVAGPVGGFLADRWGLARTAGLGTLITAAGTGLMIPLDPSWGPGELSWRLAIAGAGTGVFAGANFTMIMSAAPTPLQGTAGAAQSLARQLGFSFGPALATTFWALSGYGLSGMRTGMALATAAGILGLLILWRTAARPVPAPESGRKRVASSAESGDGVP